MKSNLKYIIVLVVIKCFLSGCKKGGFQNKGRIIATDRNIEHFTKISLYNNINLILTQDTIEKIKVEARENIISNIITEIIDKELIIKTKQNSIISKPNDIINVYVSIKKLEFLNYQGAGNVTTSNILQAPYIFVFSHEGAGNVELNLNSILIIAGLYNNNADFIFKGQSDSSYVYCSSRGTIDFRDLKVKRIHIDYSGVRNAYISASETLKATIFYKGNVYYKGSPKLEVQLKNEGKLLPF